MRKERNKLTDEKNMRVKRGDSSLTGKVFEQILGAAGSKNNPKKDKKKD